MGGVCSVVQGVLAAGFVVEGITEAALKAKIQAILNEHDEEFKIMNALSSFLDKILDQHSLVPQLNANILFATDNWNTIFDDLEYQNDLLKKIIEKFPNVNPSDFSYDFKSGMMFAVSVLAFGYIAYNFVAGNTRPQLSQDMASFKEFCSKTGAKIRGSAPEIKGAKPNQNGTLDVESHGSNAEKVPPEARKSKISEVKQQEKQGWKSKAVTGVRLVFIAVAIYGFVEGVIGLVHLKEQLDTYKKYFQSGGEFEQAQDGVIELMTLAAGDIFSLANCARAAYYDSKNMFLVRSVTMPKNHDKVLEFAAKMNPKKVGLTDLFISQSNDLVTNCNITVSSQKDRKQKLKQLLSHYKKYFQSSKPEVVFLNSSIELSQVVSKYGVIGDDINQAAHQVVRYLTKISEFFEDYRDSDFDSQPAEDKKETDERIITKSLDKYLSIFEMDESMTLDTMDEATKDIIFYSIVSFTDTFYYDDPTGATLFGKNIKQSKKDTNYGNIMNEEHSKADFIPISYEDKVEEAKTVQLWIDMAVEQNAKEGNKYWAAGSKIDPRIRYIRLEVTKYTSHEGKEVSVLTNFEGFKFEVKKDIFTLEKATVGDGVLKLQKVL